MKLYWHGAKALTPAEIGNLNHLKNIYRGEKGMGTKDTHSEPEIPKRFSDFTPKLEFYPDLPKVKLAEVLDKEVIVGDAYLVKGFKTSYGDGNFVLMLLTDVESGEQFTTLSSGEVVVAKVVKAKEEGWLPLKAVITYNGKYYDIA